jgi:hypothetical protein
MEMSMQLSRARVGLFLVTGAIVSACSGNEVTGFRSLPAEESSAKGAVDTRPVAYYVVADSVFAVGPNGEPAILRGAGIRGDGRMKNGQARPLGFSGSEYQHSYCGVSTLFEIGTTDNYHSTPAGLWSAKYQTKCGPERSYRYFLNGPDDPAPYGGGSGHSNARGLYGLPVGTSAIQRQGFGVSLTSTCGRLMFDDAFPPSNSPMQQRLSDSTRSDGVVVRRWSISSRGSHYAVCGNLANDVFVPNGVAYYLPFFIAVVEVSYPYPKFP